MKVQDLEFIKSCVKINVPKSKTDQIGLGQMIYLPEKDKFCPIKLLCIYLFKFDLCEKSNAYLFSSLKWNKDSKIWYANCTSKLSYSAAYTGFKQILRKFDLDPKNFSLHSPRIGGTTDAFKANMPHHIIDRRGRWRNPGTKFLYSKDSEQNIIDAVIEFS